MVALATACDLYPDSIIKFRVVSRSRYLTDVPALSVHLRTLGILCRAWLIAIAPLGAAYGGNICRGKLNGFALSHDRLGAICLASFSTATKCTREESAALKIQSSVALSEGNTYDCY